MSDPRPRRGLGETLDALPLRGLFLVVVLAYVVLGVVLRSGQQSDAALDLVLRVVGGCVFAGVLVLRVARARRRLGGAAGVASFRRAHRTGDVPADAPRAEWRGELDRQRRRVRRSLWIVLPFAAAGVASACWIAVSSPRAAAPALGLAAIFILLVVVDVAGVLVARRRFARLEHALDASAPAA